jgi:cytochrome c biogenesis protein|tara:strand:- start:208 stop:1476 length:1269 start_codon:yes stop_codon:yes gene_type:complete
MKRQFFKFLADLRFAICLLLIIALSSIIGTVIEQNLSIETYKVSYPLNNPVFGFLSWDIILKFGFDHVYKTWWFIFLIGLFGISLLMCTAIQQIPELKIARRCQFFRTKHPFRKLKISTCLKLVNPNKLIFKIKENQYSIFQQKNIVYCYKGLIGKFAPIIVHFSMILVLFGSIIGALNGFNAQEIIPKTEMFHIQNILDNGQFTLIPKTSARVNDFWITYSEEKTINQFYSNISILDQTGNEVIQKTLYVNLPATYQHINYYQTDWTLLALRLKKNTVNLVTQYPLVNFIDDKNKIWISWIPTNTKLSDGFSILISNLQGYCSVYDKSGSFLGNIELNESFNSVSPLTLVDVISCTGLQIKIDPGLPLIYSGFAFLMLSTLTSYITYSQVWIVNDNKSIYIGGNTSRAKYGFEIEFFKLTI